MNADPSALPAPTVSERQAAGDLCSSVAICVHLWPMHITMVKKELRDGRPCRKCEQAMDTLMARKVWNRIDEVVVAKEGDASSPGVQLATKHHVDVAPFFIVRDDGGEQVYTSVMLLIKERLAPPA